MLMKAKIVASVKIIGKNYDPVERWLFQHFLFYFLNN